MINSYKNKKNIIIFKENLIIYLKINHNNKTNKGIYVTILNILIINYKYCNNYFANLIITNL